MREFNLTPFFLIWAQQIQTIEYKGHNLTNIWDHMEDAGWQISLFSDVDEQTSTDNAF